MPFSRGVLCVLGLATLARLATAEPTATPALPPAASPAPEDKLARFKSADELWKHFQALQNGPRTPGTTPEERERAFKEFVTELHATAERFARNYPKDPRRWEARLAAARLVQTIQGRPDSKVEKLYRQAAAAPDAPAEVKAGARLGLIHMHREALKEDSPAEQVAAWEAEVAAFATDFPADPRRWEAHLAVARRARQAKQRSPEEVEKLYQQVAAAPDAPAEIKASARLELIYMHREALKDDSPIDQVAAWEAELAAFAADFPTRDNLPRLLASRADVWQRRDSAKAGAILAELAEHPNPDVAKEAEARLRRRNIKNQPLALSFTAVDGRDVDLSKLLGKVVVVDFWATSDAPDTSEIDQLVASYDKLHAQGLEIVGISLDRDKQKLLTFIEDKKITWPIYFDGKGWKNEISSQYAIRGLPLRWVVNKQGFVVLTGHRGDITEIVTRLLRE
ncbi:MAG TPA: TlpA disulfide reductase family protein [Chthoniobacteraceae bacterium]